MRPDPFTRRLCGKFTRVHTPPIRVGRRVLLGGDIYAAPSGESIISYGYSYYKSCISSGGTDGDNGTADGTLYLILILIPLLGFIVG